MRQFMVLLIFAPIVSPCLQLWSNQCANNRDCCAGLYCDRHAEWQFGVCKELIQVNQSAPASEECHQEWYNQCKANDECCSGLCHKGPNNDWKEGVCRNATVQFNDLAGNGTCHKLWFNGCTLNGTKCCDGECFMGHQWEHGVCKWPDLHKEKIQIAKDEGSSNQCTAINCMHNSDCCTGYCYRGPTSNLTSGQCTAVQMILEYKMNVQRNASSSCSKEEVECAKNSECCSGVCLKARVESRKGLCKPSEYRFVISLPTTAQNHSRCIPLYSKGCSMNSECCGKHTEQSDSTYCDRGPDYDWKVGVCRPKPWTLYLDKATNETNFCFEDWYDKCRNDAECCSGRCYKDAAWYSKYGACMPKTFARSRNRRIQKRSTNNNYLMVCYIGTWANYKQDDGKFVIEDIDPNVCTHLVYGFAKLEAGKIESFDPWLDLSKDEPGGGLDAFARFNALKEKNSRLKTLIAIGGWNQGSTNYSIMAATQAGRQRFAQSVVAFLDKYHFDGLDVDWEYPSTRGGQPGDRQAFTELIRTLSNVLHARGYTLSLAVSANPRTVDSGYDVPKLHPLVDFISIMSYDYHGSFDNITGHNAPLFARPDDTDSTFNVNYGVRHWLGRGAPPGKLVLGLPLYGRTVTLEDRQRSQVNDPHKGPGEKGKYSGEAGAIYFREVCALTKDKEQWDVRWDSTAIVPYMVKDDQWISFDNPTSLRYKVMLAQKLKLGGVMVWSMESDDFQNKCGMGKNPLIGAIVEAMSNPVDFEQMQAEEQEQSEEKKCAESGVDSILGISQLKSFFQWMSGDEKCAKATQERFVRTAPVISQITSLVQAAGGRPDEARKTQLAFLKNLEQQLDSTPLLGHFKGQIHAALGDEERAKQIFKDATRPVAVIGGAIGGTFVGGPAGAVAGGIAAGTSYDATVTGIESAVKGEFTAYGNIDSVPTIFKEEATPGEAFDTVFGIVGDGMSGAAAGKMFRPKPKGTGTRRCRRSGGCIRWAEPIVSEMPERFRYDNVRFVDKTFVRPVAGLDWEVVSSGRGRLSGLKVQRNSAAKDRVEFVSARIESRNLKKGTATNDDTRAYSRRMGIQDAQYYPDEAGHIIARELGGSGTDERNIFPQNRYWNRSPWKYEVEFLVRQVIGATGSARFDVRLHYRDQGRQLATRPYSLTYRIRDASGKMDHTGDMPNTPIHRRYRASDFT